MHRKLFHFKEKPKVKFLFPQCAFSLHVSAKSVKKKVPALMACFCKWGKDGNILKTACLHVRIDVQEKKESY
jgi:hypothetical protein